MGSSQTKPASNGCAFQWQTDADDDTGGRGYRTPLTTDAAGARRLAAFVAARRDGDGMILSDTRSGTATLLSAAGISDDLDGAAGASVSISELTREFSSPPPPPAPPIDDGGRSDGKNARADRGRTSSPNVLPLWCELSQPRSTIKTPDGHSVTIRAPVRMTTCVMAHRLTLAFDVAHDMPPGNRRTHRVFNWTAIVRLSSCAARVAVHMWPHAASRVRDDAKSQTDGWERASTGVASRAMSARFSACPPRHLVAELADGSVAALDLGDEAALSRLAAPSFSGWTEYKSVEAAYAAAPAIGVALQHPLPSYVAAVPRTLDARFPERSRMSGVPSAHTDPHRVVAISRRMERHAGATEDECFPSPAGDAVASFEDEKFGASTVAARGLTTVLTHDGRDRKTTVTLFEAHSRRVREQRAFDVDRGFATLLSRVFPPNVEFRSESLHRLPHSGDLLGFIRAYDARGARPSKLDVRRSPTLWMQLYDCAFSHRVIRAFHPCAMSVRVRTVLPNDDVLCRVTFRSAYRSGCENEGDTDGGTLVLRPSTGRCRVVFPNDTDCDPLVWLPPCPLVSGARRERIATALDRLSPRDLIDLVYAYDTIVAA